MNRVLIITYYWPPSGGAGVQRWLKFSKYLPQFGWEPYILTVNPEHAAYPDLDPSLERDIPDSIKVFRTKATDWFRFYGNDKSKVPSAGFAKNKDDSLRGKISRFIRGNFFIPDPRKGWNKYAIRKACEIIEDEKIRHVITTSPPHSTQLIGLKLKKKYPDIRWITDLRDPWTEIYYYEHFYPTFLPKKIDQYYERKVLENADKITTVGPSLKNAFSQKITGIENKTEVITNGYDEADFEGRNGNIPSRFTITYVGTLAEAYPIDGLISVLAKIRKQEINFLLRFVGTVPDIIRKRIVSELSMDSVEFIAYTSHSEAITYMMNSSVLLLVIPDHSKNKSIVTGKIFEYIASKKPILCLGPDDGDAAGIIMHNNFGKSYSYFDCNNIEDFIISTISDPLRRNNGSNKFTHRNLAKKLASLLE